MNAERKEAYIEEKRKNATVFANFELIMNLAAPLEEEYGRDICEWSENEIVRLYKYYSTTSYTHLVQLNCTLTNYTDWCLDNGLVRDGINHFRNVSTETLVSCIDLYRLRRNSIRP